MQEEQTKSQSRIEKEKKVAKLSQNFAATKTLVFWNYSGLKVSQLQDLCSQLASVNSKVTIAKNTLISFALKSSDFNLKDQKLLEGPTAVLEASDEIQSLKILTNFIKSIGVGNLKFGFLSQNFADAATLEYLASLPPKEAVFGQIANYLYSPIYNIVSVLEGNLRNLVYTLSSIKH